MNGSPFANGGDSPYLGLKDFHALEMGGRTDPKVSQAGRPGPTGPGSFGPVRSSLRSRGSSCIYALCLSICTILMMSSSRPRWRFFSHEVRSFTLQSSGVFLSNTSVLATFGSDFIKLLNTNVTPRLLLWTCCDSILYVHVFLQNITLSNVHTKMNLLFHYCA
jgi:hypothetical protein